MTINRLSKYDFAISQSISGSFNTGDTIEASFLAKGGNSAINSYVTQFVDLKYSVSSESISLQEFPKGTFPERFYIGSQYTTQSFTAGIPEPIQLVQFTLTGSLDNSGPSTYNSGGAANYQNSVQLDYDGFEIKVHTPKTELTDSGLLVFTSPSKFIKADSDGIEIKGGNIEAEKITARQLEVFGDATIFGDVTATANEPYTDTPQNISNVGSAGESALFARGDHQHNLPFATLDAVAQEGDFTNISGSATSTGSFGHLKLPDGGQIHLGTGRDFQIYHSGANSFIQDQGTGDLKILGTNLKLQDKDGGDYLTATDNAGVKIFFNDAEKLETTNTGINVTGEITASGNISASGTSHTFGGDVAILDDLNVGGSGNGRINVGSIGVLNGESTTLFGIASPGIINIQADNDGNNGGAYDEVRIEAGSTRIMTLSGSGNVGIGTSTPIANLDIRDGHIKVGEANIYASNVDQPYLIVADDDFYTGETTNWGTYGMQHRIKTNSGGVPRLTIDTPGGERFSVDNSGKVGIGTSSPAGTLHISSSNDPNLIIEDPNGSALVRFKRTDTSKVFDLSMQGSDLRFTPTDKDGTMNVLVGVDASSDKIDSRLGVGKPTPSEALDVSGSMNISGPGHITASGNISASGTGLFSDLNITHGGTAITFNRAGHEQVTMGQGNANRFFIRNTNDGRNDLVILDDGKTAIGGNDAPTKTLVVAGDISASGELKVESHITASGNISVSGGFKVGGGITGSNSQAKITLDGSIGSQIAYGNQKVTANSSVLKFETGGSERVRILNGGNVGIGTITPGEKLEVVGNISASGILNTKQLVFGEPTSASPTTIKFSGLNTLSSSKTAGLMWDFPNDDVFIYAHQSSSDQTRLVFEASDNLSDGMIFWFNDFKGPHHDAFPLFMQGDRFVVNNPVDRRATYHKDQNHPSSSWNGGPAGGATGVNFYLIKSGSTSVSRANSLIFGNVADSQVTINGDITASGNISSSGDGLFNKVGINTASPAADLHINDSGGEATLLLTGPGSNPADAASLRFSEQSDGNNYVELKYDGSANILSFDSNNQNDMLSIDRTNNRVFTGDSTSFKVGSHITASGNISSSGIITGEGLVISDDAEITDDLTVNGDIRLGTNDSSRILFKDNDGNYSESSGSIHKASGDSLRFKNWGNFLFNQHNPNGQFSIFGTTDKDVRFRLLHASNKVEIPTGSLQLRGGNGTGGHITASGNISASGKITGDDFEFNLPTDNNRKFKGNTNRGVRLQNTSGGWAMTYGFLGSGGVDLGGFGGLGGTGLTQFFIGYNYTTPLVSFFSGSSNDGVLIGHFDSTSGAPEMLTVEGNISASGVVFADRFESKTGGTAIDFNDDLLVAGTISASNDLTISDGTRTLKYDVSAGELNHSGATLNINKTNGVDTSFDNGTLYVDASANRVGIGVTNPTGSLTIAKQMTPSASFFDSPHLKLESLNTDNYDGKVGIVLESSTNRGGYGASIAALRSGTNGHPDIVFNIHKGDKEGTEVLRIDEDGQVGIGTTTPTAKLDVRGKISASNDLSVRDGIFSRDGIAKVEVIGLNGTGGIVGTDTNHDLLLRTNNSEHMRITTGGNVGIGTTSPVATEGLTIKQARTIGSNNDLAKARVSASFVIEDSSTHYSAFDANEWTQYGGNLFMGALGNNASEGNIYFRAGTSSLTTRMFISSSGNVGIGVSDPDQKLEVTGNIKASGTLFVDEIHSPTQTTNKLILEDDQSLATNMVSLQSVNFINLMVDGNGNGTGGLNIMSGSYDADTAKTMVRVDSGTGNVGIGTSSPVSTLHIEEGDIRIDTANNGTQALRFSETNTTKAQIQYVDSNEKLHILTNGSTKAISIDNSQNVGINNDSPSEKLDVDGNIKARDKISSTTFESGFAGSGFRIETGSAGTSFTVDDLTIRGTMSVFELMIHQIRATNGSLFVSNTGKLNGVEETANFSEALPEYKLIFDTGSGYGHSFQVGDMIRAQRFVPSTNGSGSTVFKSDLHITSVTGTGSAVGVLTGSDIPQVGFEYVRLGNRSEADRQGIIYLTADDDNAPFIDVADKITKHSDFNTSGKIKTRIGKLDGITTSTRFGTLSGYGFYASGSAFLEGSINATSGSIGDFIIDDKEIRDSSNDLRLKSTGQITASKALIKGNSEIAGFDITDTQISSQTGTLILKSSGQISGSAVSMSGVISATQGNIGGFTIDEDEIKSTDDNLILNSNNKKFSIGSSTFGGHGVQFEFNGGSPKLHLGRTGHSGIRFQGSALQITSSKVEISGSEVDIQTPKFFLGKEQSQFISGSNDKIEISSSNFHLANDGKVQMTGNVTMSDDVRIEGGLQIGAFPELPSEENLIGYWSLSGISGSIINDDDTLLDNSGNNNNGTAEITGTPISMSFADGPAGTSIQFLSESKCDVKYTSDAFDFDHTDSFSLSIWVKRFHPNTGSADATARDSGDTPPSGQGIFVKGSTGNSYGIIYNQSGNVTAGVRDSSTIAHATHSPSDNFTGSFHHVVMTIEPNSTTGVKLYVDSELKATANNTGMGNFNDSNNLEIGANRVISGNGARFNGFLAEPRVYNKTLSASEVRALYLNPAGNGTTLISGDTISTGKIKSNNLTAVAGSEFDLTKGTIKLGGTTSPKFAVNAAGALTSSEGTIGGFTIDDDEIKSDNFKLNSSDESLQLGSVVDLDNDGSNSGIFASGSGEFFFGKEQGDFISFTNDVLSISSSDIKVEVGDLQITASDINMTTDTFFLGSANKFISGSGTNIEISSSGFHLKPEGDVILSGSITANDGEIGGFTIDGTQIKKLDSNGGIVIDGGTTPNINVRTGSGATTIRTMMGEVSTNRFGIFGFDTGGVNKIFELSNQEQQIAGFHFNTSEITSSTGTLKLKSNGQITGSNVLFDGGEIGGFKITDTQISASDGGILLSGSGEAILANGNIKSDKFGNLDITDARLRISSDGFQTDAFNAATGKFVDMIISHGDVQIVAFEDNTIVTRISQSGEVRDTLVLSASQVSADISDRKEGDIYDANKPIFAYNDAGMPLAPLSATGKRFLTRTARDNPVKFHFFSPFGDAEVHIASGSNNSGVFGETLADITVSQSLLTTQLGTDSAPDTVESYEITSSLPIVVAIRNTSGAGDFVYVPPVSKEVFTPSDINANTLEGNSGQTISNIDKTYYFSNTPFGLHDAGDGNGTDAEQGLPIEMLGDTYVVPHTLSDYRITAVESGDIKVYRVNNDDKILYRAYQISGSKTSPQEIEVGHISGSDNKLFDAQSVRFEGTIPFFLRVNDNNENEYPVLGYRRTQTSQYQNSTTIEGDRVKTGKIQSNNFSTTAGSEINLDDGTFTLGGSSNPDLSFDGSTLIVSGTISSSQGNIAGWNINQDSRGGHLSRDGVFFGALGTGNGLVLDSGSGENNFFFSSSLFGAHFRVGSEDSFMKFTAGAINNLEISSSGFALNQGEVSASSGIIGGFQLTSTAISSSGLEISSTGDMKLDSDGATRGTSINAQEGIFGHGDETTRELRTHDGMFIFTEDVISFPPGTGGVSFNKSTNEIDSAGGTGAESPGGTA